MKRILLGVSIVLLLLVNLFLLAMIYGPADLGRQDVVASAQAQQVTLPPETVWVPPTEPTEPVETTKPDEVFTLTFAGDCVLGSPPGSYYAQLGYIKTVGEDLSHPFKNVASYFEDDDFSLVNLECVLGKESLAGRTQPRYLGRPEYAASLSGAGIEAVSLANDLTMSYGQTGYTSTVDSLTAQSISYVQTNQSALVTTQSGLVVGLYGTYSDDLDQRDMSRRIIELKEQGAQVIVVAVHWRERDNYQINDDQEIFGRAAIEEGANIVVGTGPRVLQKMEEYNGGVIFYSLGKLVNGASTAPKDFDTAIVRQQVILHGDGSVSLGERTLIPVSGSSVSGTNNFQPIPYAEGSPEYDRVLKKLAGTFG